MDSAEVAMSKFIDSTAALMESLQDDIRAGDGLISNETVVALARLLSHMEAISRILDGIKARSEQLN